MQISLLPLFQGMGQYDINEVVAHTRFNFETVGEGCHIVVAGEECQGLVYILSGDYVLRHEAVNGDCVMTEWLSGEMLVQPERLYGLNQHYTIDITALTPCPLMTVGKEEVQKLLSKFAIFRLNLLNRLSADVQRGNDVTWNIECQGLEMRIRQFLLHRCHILKGEKELRIRMTTLADYLGDSRLNVSRALNKLQDDGLLTLHRGRICFSV